MQYYAHIQLGQETFPLRYDVQDNAFLKAVEHYILLLNPDDCVDMVEIRKTECELKSMLITKEPDSLFDALSAFTFEKNDGEHDPIWVKTMQWRDGQCVFLARRFSAYRNYSPIKVCFVNTNARNPF